MGNGYLHVFPLPSLFLWFSCTKSSARIRDALIEAFSYRASDMIIQMSHPKFWKALPIHTYAMDRTQPDQIVQQILPITWVLDN